MKLKVDRAWKKSTYCIGKFFINGIRFHESMEDTDRGLNSGMSEAEIRAKKVYGKTAIPTGTYKVILSVSPKFKTRAWAKDWGGRTPEILGVKGFSSIRIHCGSTAEDSLGCILVGENTIVGKLTKSQKCFHELMRQVVPAFERGEEITITIK